MQYTQAQKSSTEAMKCSVSNFLVLSALWLQGSLYVNHNFSRSSFKLRNLHQIKDHFGKERTQSIHLLFSLSQGKKNAPTPFFFFFF